MKLLKSLSAIGIVFSLGAHVISWFSPNLLHFALIGIPLQVISMGIMGILYQNRAVPLQRDANLRWWHHSSSIVHGLVFLSVLSFVFQVIMLVFGSSAFVMFLIRSLSAIWVFTFAAGYGYASWAIRYAGREKLSHRGRFQTHADIRKTDIHAQVTTTTRHSFGKRHGS